MLRLGGWKLTRLGRHDTLFDMTRDPGETKDVTWRHRDVADALGRELDQRVTRRRSASLRLDTSPEVSEGLKALGYTE